MALKSLFEVEVDDAQFREFEARFAAYEGKLRELPGTAGDAAAVFDKLVAQQRELTANGKLQAIARGRALELDRRDEAAKAKANHDALSRLQKIHKVTSDWATRIVAGAVGWKDIARSSEKVYRHVDTTTKALSKWVLMKGVFGLAGIGGGLYGLDRLAGMAAGERRRAMGTGVPYGKQQAFALDFGRFTDGNAMMGAIGTAKGDATSAQYLGLLGAGISADEIRRMNGADLGVELFDKLPGLFPRGANDPTFGAAFSARGLDSLLSPEDAKRYLNASPDERAAQRRAYGDDSRSMAADPASLRKWADLDQALSRAKGSIETALIQGLAPLAPEISDLSKGVVKLVSDFLKSSEVKSDLDDIVKGLDSFDKALNDPSSWWNRAGNALNSFSKAEKDAGAATHSWVSQNAPWATWEYWKGMISGRAPNIRYGRQHTVAPFADGGATPTGAHDPLKDLIAQHETGGTGAAGYDTVLGHAERGGPFAPPKPVSQMTIADVLAYQHEMRAKAGTAAFPVGRAQWTESTLRGLTRGMDPSTVFSPDLQERLFDRSIAGRMGQGPGGFRSEWASLGGVSDAEIGAAMAARRDAVQRLSAMARGTAGDGTPNHIRGTLRIGDETYTYGSGGVRGSQHIPYGDYPINPDAPGAWGRANNAMAVNNDGSIWDAPLGRMRTGIEMHEAHSADMVTEGCLSFLKEQYPHLKARVREMIAKTGHAYLHIGERGASITSSPDAPRDGDGVSVPKGAAQSLRSAARRAGIDFHREVQALHRRVAVDALKSEADEAHQHFSNMRTVLRAREGRAEPWQHSFRAAVEAARARRDVERVREGGSEASAGPQASAGLGLHKLQRADPRSRIHVSNDSGSNIHAIAIAGSYG